MEVAHRHNSGARLGTVACGAALASAAVYTAVNDPGRPGARFIPCAFHRLTGLWCPGCGLTRGTHALFNGDPLAMLSYNVFTPLVLAGIVVAYGVWALRAWGHQVRNPIDRLPAAWGRVLLVGMVAYGVVRNIPLGPLRALAP